MFWIRPPDERNVDGNVCVKYPRVLDFLTFQLREDDIYMALVKIKEKYQVTLPAALRQKAGLEVGDLLEAKVEGKKITLTPKKLSKEKPLDPLTQQRI